MSLRRRRLLILLAGPCALALVGSGARPTDATASASVPASSPPASALVAGDATDRSAPTPLDGSTRATALHAWVADTGTIASVTFSLDGGPATRESSPPYDLGGTRADGGPGSIALAPGPHTLRATVVAKAGGSTTVGAAFSVGRTVPVSTAGQLRSALAAAVPGDVISLADGSYVGSPQFEAAADGTAARPVLLVGGRNAVLTTQRRDGGPYGLHVTGDW